MFKKVKRFAMDFLSKTDEIQVTEASQPHVLACRMNQAGLSHNEVALVDLPYVRVIKGKLEEAEASNMTTLFFCPMSPLEIKERVSAGDMYSIPDKLKVKLEGVTAPRPKFKRQAGIYTLTNVLVCANGSLTIKSTDATKWVRHDDY